MSKRRLEEEAGPSPSKKQKEGYKPSIYPPGFELPDGWLECPSFGHCVRSNKTEGGFIPSKVPLGNKFSKYISEDKQFTPAILVQQLRKKGYEVGLVIDLTYSWRYYDPQEFYDHNISHMKIKCRGRGEVPEPEVVNQFCFEAHKFRVEERQSGLPQRHILVHCTHGYNRTGYMITNWLIRSEGMNVAKAVSTFAAFRSPGIYKDSYIHRLFKYNHELRIPTTATPPHPDWKAEDDPEGPEELQLTEEDLIVTAEGTDMAHDDLLGEDILEEEEFVLKASIIEQLTGNPYQEGQDLRFPGSQPVSLARANLELLNQRRYWVTWKADGTRYLLLANLLGTYLMDRSFRVRRLQMRFPCPGLKARHHCTLLDGEMVVDEDLETGLQTRRFLAYDVMLINGRACVHLPFEERWHLLEKHVAAPRAQERQLIEQGLQTKKPVGFYRYNEEPFRLRRKDFWPLPQASKLLKDFIPNLSHESDGLIFQGAEDRYERGTFDRLLKWKFAHLNSVDFLLRISPTGEKQLALLEARRSHGGGPMHMVNLPGAKIIIDDESAQQWLDAVIECTWNREQQSWKFLRDRKDKETPNAYHVYEKVMKSIEDNIDEEALLGAVDEALQNSVYDKDRHSGAEK